MNFTKCLGSVAAGLLLVACGGGGGGGNNTTDQGNTELTSLTMSVGTLVPAFDAGTFTYQVEVANSVTSVAVTAQTADSGATIAINGSVPDGSGSVVIPLAVGTSAVGVVVTARDGVTTKTYEAYVTRLGTDPSKNADLASLELSAGTLQPAFSADVTEYSVKVANPVAQIAFTAVVAGACATVEVRAGSPTVPAGAAAAERSGGPVGCGAPSAPVPVAIPVGSSTIEFVVTAGDGTTKKTYAVTVNRAAAGVTP